MENRDSGHGTHKYLMRAHQIIKKKSFTNELGNKIKARVTKYDDGRKEPIKVELIGPDSTSEDNITKQEAGVLADLITSALNESAGGTFTVYHGTESKFKTFADPARGSANGTAPINMTGFNFTDNPECARTFGPNVLQCQVTITRPLVINAKGASYSDFKHILNDKLSRLSKPAQRAKYDGVIITRYADAGIHGDEYIESNHFIPFTTDQIKITGREIMESMIESVVDRAMEKRILDRLWHENETDRDLDYQISTVMNYDPNEREFENDDPDGDPIPVNTPEGQELYREGFDKLFDDRIQEAVWNIESKFKDGKIWLFRVITASRDWAPKGDRGPGIYWSWDREAADAHWGNFGSDQIKWLLTAQVTSEQIDWETSVFMNASEAYEEEKEVRLKSDDGVEFEWEEWKPGKRGW